jgi:uncharacterized protein affecting Mg2+/Co2+ transport
VEGEGVIGLYPLLTPGMREPFQYASATSGASRSGGSMGGHFVMVPGKLAQPAGPPFQAKVGTWQLTVPDYFY